MGCGTGSEAGSGFEAHTVQARGSAVFPKHRALGRVSEERVSVNSFSSQPLETRPWLVWNSEINLPLVLKCWDYRRAAPCQADFPVLLNAQGRYLFLCVPVLMLSV